MPDGSTGLPSISTTNPTFTTITTIAAATSIPPLTSPASTSSLRASLQNAAAMKAKLFGPASPTGRPKTGHHSIRGKISGPIPIPNAIDDDEFPIRNPGTGIASPNPIEHDVVLQDQLQPPPALGSPAATSFTPSSSGGRVDVPQTVPENPSPPSPHSNPAAGPSPEGSSRSSGAQRNSPLRHQRINPSSGTVRHSIVSASDSHNTNNTSNTSNTNNTGTIPENGPPSVSLNGYPNGPLPQRKKSTLRTALSKFLRRKKKENSLSSISEAERQSAFGQPLQHHSVPPASKAKDSETKRTASMPITEFDRALRSHSIGPDDITAIESARNSVQVEPSQQSPTRRRAATTSTTSKLFVSPRSRGGEEWSGLSPRPASTHGRGSRFLEEENPDDIGRAITSDIVGEAGHKRRSRSLSGLQELASGRQDPRRRSAEIRYWRESYEIPGPVSPLSSGPNENETENNDDNETTGRISMSVPGSPVLDRPPKTPPQPFTFGSIASMNEMAGMKITQAASLDMRFGTLEARVQKLERIVDQLCCSVPGFRGPLMEIGSERSESGLHSVAVSQPTFAYSSAMTPPTIPAIYQIVPCGSQASGPRYAVSGHSEDTDDASHMSFGEGQTYTDSLHPPSSSAAQSQSTPVTSGLKTLLRPTSESTVRPATSGAEQAHGNMAAQLEAERAARQALEAQVKKLSERMNNLSTTMFAMVRDPNRKSQERLRPPTSSATSSVQTSLATISVVGPPSQAQSIFGGGDDPNDPPSKADDEYSESFQTPKEEAPTSFGAFGEQLVLADDEEVDPKRRKAARTLSLSQLTSGKEAEAPTLI